MNIDNQLILGIVFITAGIALALLAYAALLNRGEAEPEEGTVEGEVETDGRAAIPEQPDEQLVELPTEQAADAEGEPTAAPAADSAAETVQPAAAEPPPPEPTVEAPSPEPEGAAQQAADRSPEARILRDPGTARLMVEIEGNQYRSMEALRLSDDWVHVSSLFGDMLAWMVKKEPAAEGTEDPPQRETAAAGKSMIDQINDILAERMENREDELAGVRLMASTDGSIRVFVGLESYAMDEVPDPEVREVIRKAVAEWESRQ